MTNWNQIEKKRQWSNLKALSRLSPGGSQENHGKPVKIAGLLAVT
jgi:hypothetical protein